MHVHRRVGFSNIRHSRTFPRFGEGDGKGDKGDGKGGKGDGKSGRPQKGGGKGDEKLPTSPC